MRKALILFALFPLLSWNGLAQGTGLSGLKICIDPGHGGYDSDDRHVIPDPGIDFWESESNFQKALLLQALLQAQGATVILTRYNNLDPEPTLSERVATANSNNVDWFHSIHSNAFNGAVNYTLLLVREKRSLTDPAASTGNGLGIPEQQGSWDISATYLAPGIYSKLRTTSYVTYLDWTFYGGVNGGFSLGVLRGLLMPGELSEGSFHDYYPETRRLMNNDYRKMEAYAIRNSFMQYFAVPPDTTAIVAGIQRNVISQAPINYTTVRLLPEGRTYYGDQYNNGFFMFGAIAPGPHTVRFETPGFAPDSVTLNPGPGSTSFADRTLVPLGYPTVLQSTPVNNDTAFPASQPVRLAFSTVMDTASVRTAFSISPSVPGRLLWSNSNSVCTFDPDSLFPFYVNFTVTIDTGAHSSAGSRLDGNGDGVPGDAFVLHFKTIFVDVTPPAIVDIEPDSIRGLFSPGGPVTITFGEGVDLSTITTTNFAIQKIGGGSLGRTLQTFQAGGRTGVTMYPSGGLAAGAAYRVRISGVKDMSGNAIPSTSPVLWTFAVDAGTYTYTAVDSLDAPPARWRPALASPHSAGVDSATFTFSPLSYVQSIPGDPGSAVLRYVWDTTAGNWLLDESLDSAHALLQPHWRRDAAILRAYVLGDGSGTRFRFLIDDSVDVFPEGDQAHQEVSPWIPITWIGWNIVEWEPDSQGTGIWTGNGILEGDLRFRGFQLSYVPGSSNPSGSLAVDQIEIAERHPLSVPGKGTMIPVAFALYPAYPNPFNPSTQIRYDLPAGGRVSLHIFDILGQDILSIVDADQAAGRHDVVWNGADREGIPVASGVYFARLQFTSAQQGAAITRIVKMLLTR